MLENRPGRKSMSKYAWMAPVIVALAFSLIYLFGNGGSDHIRTLDVTEHYERVQIDHPGQHESLQPSVELSADRRQSILQKLSSFRAEYKMLGPAVTVVSLKATNGSMQLAQRIGGLLAQNNLGNYASDPTITENINGFENDGVIISVRSADKAMAHNLASALSPMLSGTVRIQFDDTRRPGNLLLGIAATPGFSDQGIAVFRR